MSKNPKFFGAFTQNSKHAGLFLFALAFPAEVVATSIIANAISDDKTAIAATTLIITAMNTCVIAAISPLSALLNYVINKSSSLNSPIRSVQDMFVAGLKFSLVSMLLGGLPLFFCRSLI